MALALLLLRADEAYGLSSVLLLVALVWATDIGAFFSGRLIGGPKLCSRISPGKTWSGFIGGLLSSVFVGAAFAYVTQGAPVGVLAFVSGCLGLTAQLGDLFESAVKRRFSVKDSGRILPGHGGLLDRVDGIAFAAVAEAILGVARSGPSSVGYGVLVW